MHLWKIKLLSSLNARIFNISMVYDICLKILILKGENARKIYKDLRREAASLKLQTYYRMYYAQKNYNQLVSSAIAVQSGLRGMVARKELLFRRQRKASIIIQVS